MKRNVRRQAALWTAAALLAGQCSVTAWAATDMPETATEFGTEAGIETEVGTGVEVGTGTEAGTGVEVGTGTEVVTEPEIGTGTEAVTGTETGIGGEAGTGTEVGNGTGTEVGIGAEVGTGTGTEAGTEAGTGMEAGTEVGTGAEVGTGTETGTGTEVGTGTGEAAPQVPAETYEVTEADIDAYFDNSVMIGDSVMEGFRNYCMNRRNTWLDRIQFLTATSFSTRSALLPVAGKNIHPVYAGAKRPIWESVSMMGAKKVFMFFGLNDINISGIEGTCENYKAIVNNMKTLVPDVEINLISMTYTLRGKSKGQLNNDNIRRYNDRMSQLAAENGWGFVNLAPHLADANGDLAPVYCSDHYVHQTTAAYDVWTAVLRQYARERLEQAARQKAEEEAAARAAEEAAKAAEEAARAEAEARAAAEAEAQANIDYSGGPATVELKQ